jgi:hypothetical protein
LRTSFQRLAAKGFVNKVDDVAYDWGCPDRASDARVAEQGAVERLLERMYCERPITATTAVVRFP